MNIALYNKYKMKEYEEMYTTRGMYFYYINYNSNLKCFWDIGNKHYYLPTV